MASFGSNSSSREDEGKRFLEQSFPTSPSKLDMLHHPEVKFDLPASYRFFRSDDEMILDFLLNKNKGYELPLDLISEFIHGRPNEAYFFTLIPQTYSTTEQMERAINGGCWRAKGQVKKIYHEHEIVGFKRKFVFYEGQAPTAKESPWVMHEFSVNPSLVGDDEPDLRAKVAKFYGEVCAVQNHTKEEYAEKED
ncbi:hypothetical protein DITRI_Ditri06bG0103400 [Diplodiscus trichospermus]